MIKPDYRVLWTWDYATYWDNSYFPRAWGSSGINCRREAFLRDYKRLIDFASAHHYNGVVIWGAVRAHHNGFDQLKELVRYGKEKGVRVLPGVSAFSYGGVCYDPRSRFLGMAEYPMEDHPYSMYSWLQKHPEYAAIDEKGNPYNFGPLQVVACPSRKENLEWFQEGLQWLYEEFDVDGIQVEVGDYALCHCPRCTERRKKNAVSTWYSVEDMCTTYTAAVNTSMSLKKDSWVICETYSSFSKKWKKKGDPNSVADLSDRELLKDLPQSSIVQFGADAATGGFAKCEWPDEWFSPVKNNIARIHAGSQHSQNGPADWGVNLVWDMVKNARSRGINGVSIFGEESCFNPPNEANYLALEEASGLGNPNPGCNEALFYSQTLDPLYGGSGLAQRWRELYIKSSMLRLGERLDNGTGKYMQMCCTDQISRQPLEILTDDPDFRQKALNMNQFDRVQALECYFAEAHAIASKLSGDACGRWSWLENSIWNTRYIISSR